MAPYVAAAKAWVDAGASAAEIRAARADLAHVLAASSPRAIPPPELRYKTAKEKARVAFGRLEAASVKPDRVLTIYLGVAALIEDDFGSHRTAEFQRVQAAKAIHRLASGTHKRWDMWNPKGGTVRAELHQYPRSSGLVLRQIGKIIEYALGGSLVAKAVPEIIRLKEARFGPHPSHLPGWRPLWSS